MTEIYDDPEFFAQYANLPRSRHGLAGAGEWPDFKRLLPDLAGKRVVDLGCGYGWQCRYAATQGAATVLGIDVSEKMLAKARADTDSPVVTYARADLATFTQPAASVDLVMSSLALHYVADFAAVAAHVATMLRRGGDFLFTIEHPVFTAAGAQQWVTTTAGDSVWPVDHYFKEGPRQAQFLGETVTKYHHTVSGLMTALLDVGLAITAVVEPTGGDPSAETEPWQRMPEMLIIKAHKPQAK